MHKGSCLCGAVTFEVDGDLPPPSACHCVACRKQTGHFGVSLDVPRDRVRVIKDDTLKWYVSSEKVRRGFCSTCGSHVFWDPVFHDWTAIYMGAFDGPTQTKMNLHIFVAEKGDYYDITDGLPQNEY